MVKRPDVCKEQTIYVFRIIGVTLGEGARNAIASLPIFFLPKNSFLLDTELKRV